MTKPQLQPKWRFRTTPKEVTKEDLGRLEDAIWCNEEAKAEFLLICERFTTPGQSFDEWLKTMHVWKPKALRHCWFILKWRPSLVGNILIKPNGGQP